MRHRSASDEKTSTGGRHSPRSTASTDGTRLRPGEIWWNGLPSSDHERLAGYRTIVDEIATFERQFATHSDRELEVRAQTLRSRAREGGASLDELLAEWFALSCETAARVLGERPYPPQILAGAALHEGKLAEMQTGEGKTLAAVAPVGLNALTGRGVHVLTFNDYLARRDAEWMGPVYRRLGLSVASIDERSTTAQRVHAYAADITYVTVKEAGFDLLRDGLCLEAADQVHRPFQFAVVDEADSILIDEARIPLVIAGTFEEQCSKLDHLAQLVRTLEPGSEFGTDEGDRNIFLTEAGIHRVEGELGCGNLFSSENLELQAEIRNALHALVLLERDVDYVVRGDRIELVDELTGRIADKRHWPDGLQAAVEAKEGLRLQPEGRILGSMTVQHLLERYPRIAAMTATAQPAAAELSEIYDLEILPIPTYRPCIRRDEPDLIYTSKRAKEKALCAEIGRLHATGRPVLVGTSSVGESERLAATLEDQGVSCCVLNARNDAEEAEIVAEAGALGAVTISTNMAGRGTDIRLGGSDEEGRREVVRLGGLHVIGTNRHESRRIDNQLRGRGGRQGDPGSSRFLISLEDDLLRKCGIERLIPTRLLPAGETDEPITHPAIQREVDRAQRIMEGQHGDIRALLLRYSSLVAGQREDFQQRRQIVLGGSSTSRLLEARSPDRWREARSICGEELLLRIEQRLMLLVMDALWREHLDFTERLRDEIHLVKFDGRQPVVEFFRRAGSAYESLLERIDDQVVDTFQHIEISGEGVDWDRKDLKGPSSTWTYLVNDSAFGENTFLAMANNPSLGLWAVLACWWLLIPWALAIHWNRWRKGRVLSEGAKTESMAESTGADDERKPSKTRPTG